MCPCNPHIKKILSEFMSLLFCPYFMNESKKVYSEVYIDNVTTTKTFYIKNVYEANSIDFFVISFSIAYFCETLWAIQNNYPFY